MDHSHHIVMLGALRVECIFIFMKVCDDDLCHNTYIILLLLGPLLLDTLARTQTCCWTGTKINQGGRTMRWPSSSAWNLNEVSKYINKCGA